MFAAAALMNIATAIALIDIISVLSRFQWFLLFAAVYAGISDGPTGSTHAVVGNAYLLMSVIFFGASLIRLAS